MFPAQVNISWPDIIQTVCRAKDIRNRFPDRGRGWFAAQAIQNTSAQATGVELIFNYFSFLKANGWKQMAKKQMVRNKWPRENG